jgi:hypothetical protein
LDSAVIAFWELFEPPGSAGFPVPDQRHAKVHDLPAELLLMILKLVYAQEIFVGWRDTGWMDTDINSSSLFPYAIAAVCSHWRDIMSLVPEFWTRVVIFIDLVPTTPPATVLSWSRNLPLEVIVTRVDFGCAVDIQHEQNQVVSIMKTLVHSLVNRSRGLLFNVKFSSSLPPFPDSFQGAWSNLIELFLQCQEDNGGSTDVWGSFTSTEQELEYPALKWLFVDGRNYYKACRKDSQWMVRCPSVCDLAISHYTPLSGELFSSYDFMLPIIALPSLGTLRINDVALYPSPSSVEGTLPLTLDGQGIQFSHIHDFKPIASILNLLPDNIDIALTRCATGHPRRYFNREGRLTLRDIEADQDLVPLLHCWAGEDLHVINCPGFNDAVLDLMATVVAGEYSCAPYMGALIITDCPNFSAAALRQLVIARLQVDEGRIYPGIVGVRISGQAPDISTDDQQQISQHVYEFTYHPSSP